jgi:RND family efflux transporter MFP subunit
MKIQYLILLAFLTSCAGQSATPPAAVQELPVIQIRSGEATTYQEYPATVEGTINVDIRPQISGILQHIFVDDGAYVTKGMPLFKIDEAPFQEKLNNARASLHTAQGALSNAQLEIDKLTPLVAGNVISDFQLKTAQSVREVAIGNVEQAKADIASAQINLGYTLIKSPVSGYIGRLLRKEGSIVGPADPSALTDLSDVHEVHVFFALGEYDFIRFKSQYSGTTIADKIKQLPPVELILADDSAFATKGKIDVVNGRFDDNTGAITFRATFKNEHGLLRSGNTGRIRLGLKFANQLIVPQSATQEMQDKVFVFLVGKDNKVSKQEISISGKSGTNYLVKSGLKAGDLIVYRGYDYLHEGDLIKPKQENSASSFAANN